jgi:hypothetical protein
MMRGETPREGFSIFLFFFIWVGAKGRMGGVFFWVLCSGGWGKFHFCTAISEILKKKNGKISPNF